MNIAGKSALITGGATGLGRATTLALAKLGCHVAVNHLPSLKEAADQVVAEAASIGVRAIAVAADVTQPSECARMVAETVQGLGGLQVLVNCAGVTRFIPHASLDAVSLDDWNFILGVNLIGTFQSSRAARHALMEQGGVIVNIASTAGVNGTGSSIPYSVSKAGVISLTKSLARVLAPKIRVVSVAPGFIDGRWMREGLGERYAEVKESFARSCPLGRVSEPEDVAAAIVSLITGSDLVTGQTLVCDGGSLLADPASAGIRKNAGGQ